MLIRQRVALRSTLCDRNTVPSSYGGSVIVGGHELSRLVTPASSRLPAIGPDDVLRYIHPLVTENVQTLRHVTTKVTDKPAKPTKIKGIATFSLLTLFRPSSVMRI